MKSAMPFLGVAMGDVRRIAAADARARPCPDRESMLALARELWDEAGAREERYVALAICRDRHHRRLQDARCLSTYRHFVVTGAWWDLVDETSRIVGGVLDNDPRATAGVSRWAPSPEMWLRRAAIICQRSRGARADLVLLRSAIERNAGDADVVIRKAAGWALRQYARTDPDWVRRFVAEHDLSPLTRREALKHLATQE